MILSEFYDFIYVHPEDKILIEIKALVDCKYFPKSFYTDFIFAFFLHVYCTGADSDNPQETNDHRYYFMINLCESCLAG